GVDVMQHAPPSKTSGQQAINKPEQDPRELGRRAQHRTSAETEKTQPLRWISPRLCEGQPMLQSPLPAKDRAMPRLIAALAFCAALVAPAPAKVERVEIASPEPFANAAAFGAAGAYEKLRGRAFFALDPEAAANAAIADLKLAPRRADGRVVFTADFL